MYKKTFKLHDHDRKFHTQDVKEENEKKKENPDTNSKDYDTIRRLVKDREKSEEENQIFSKV